MRSLLHKLPTICPTMFGLRGSSKFLRALCCWSGWHLPSVRSSRPDALSSPLSPTPNLCGNQCNCALPPPPTVAISQRERGGGKRTKQEGKGKAGLAKKIEASLPSPPPPPLSLPNQPRLAWLPSSLPPSSLLPRLIATKTTSFSLPSLPLPSVLWTPSSEKVGFS